MMNWVKSWDEIIVRVKSMPRLMRVVVAGADDALCLEAVYSALDDAMILPLLVGNRERIRKLADDLGISIPDEHLAHEPNQKSVVHTAIDSIKEGRGDFLMKGNVSQGSLVNAVRDKEFGKCLSYVILHEMPQYHKMLMTTDGGVVLYPDLEQKAEIICNAVHMLRSFGYVRPKVAILAGSNKVNSDMPETVDADMLKQMNLNGEVNGCLIEGPVSLELALVKERAVAQKYTSPVAGDADILMSPNRCTGNVLEEALKTFAGAVSAGILLGAGTPIVMPHTCGNTRLSLALAAAACSGLPSV